MVEPPQDQLIFLLTIGTIGILVLIVFIILFFFRHQKKMLIAQREKQKLEIEFQYRMAYAQLESQDKERVRLASDLHDSLGSMLWSAKVNASYIDRSILLKGEVKQSYEELILSLDESISIIRRIAWELTPEAFQHTGLWGSITALCNRFNGKSIDVKLYQSGDPNLPLDDAFQVFRITQELISNCIKHAQATELEVDLISQADILTLKVQDNGTGFDLSECRRGVGWWNIENRVRRMNGEIAIGKNPGGSGASITMTIPLAHDE